MVVVTAPYKLARTEITTLQFSKLIEMCDYFFPQYFFLDANEPNQIFLAFQASQGRGEVQAIPWFEVCMLHLPEKLEDYANKAKEFILEEWLYNSGDENCNHLVDYLYHIYKLK